MSEATRGSELDTMSLFPPCAGHGSGSASTASAETVTVRHVLRVQDYSAKFIKSSFLAGGHSWSIRFFSDGGSMDNTEWICFELRREQRGKDGDDVMVRIKYSFLDEVGEPIQSSVTRMMDSLCTFRRTGESSAQSQLIKREELESSYVKNNKCCIRCDVTVIEVTSMSAVVPPSDLHRHVADILHTGVGADEKFKEGGETFAAYENVTATGWHVFKVVGYSQMMGLGVARRIKSSSFLAGGHSWSITFFPDHGSSQETSECIWFGLCLEDRGTDDDIVVWSKISFLDEVGEPIPSSKRTSDSYWTFESTGLSWTFSPFKREDMESSYVRDDTFFIRCKVTVIHEACVTDSYYSFKPSKVR